MASAGSEAGARVATGPDDADGPGDVRAPMRVAQRLEEAGLGTDRFVDVKDGTKVCEDHTRLGPEAVDGNYGIYAGGGLIDVDVDGYDIAGESPGYEAVVALPDTFTVVTPHTDGVDDGHKFYRVVGGEEFRTARQALEAITGNKAQVKPSWGDLKVRKGYVVGPGSQLDGCGKEWCDACATADGGRYRIAADRPIATITADDLADVLRADRPDADRVDEESDEGGTSPPISFVDPVRVDDADLLQRAMDAKDGDYFTDLWHGRWEQHASRWRGGGSHSEADMALCGKLAFWTGKDARRMDRLFRQSGLYREKWDEDRGGRTYGELTIDTAIRNCSSVYRGSGPIPEERPGDAITDGGRNRVSWPTVRRVGTALDDLGAAATAEVVDHPAVDRGESQVRRALTELDRLGWLESRRDGRSVTYTLRKCQPD